MKQELGARESFSHRLTHVNTYARIHTLHYMCQLKGKVSRFKHFHNYFSHVSTSQYWPPPQQRECGGHGVTVEVRRAQLKKSSAAPKQVVQHQKQMCCWQDHPTLHWTNLYAVRPC
eukprot:scpid112252/ scgid14117/ 